MIHDLKRSGVNAQVKTQERVILPRLTDVVDDALDLMEDQSTGQCEFMALDFRHAFKQLAVHPDERRHLGGEAMGWLLLVQSILVRGKVRPTIVEANGGAAHAPCGSCNLPPPNEIAVLRV